MTTNSKGKPMSEQAQVGDTVLLTFTAIEGTVTASDGLLYVCGWRIDGLDRTVDILSHATRPLPSEPGTWWLDNDQFDDVWRVDNDGVLRCVTDTNLGDAKDFAPFRQLVLK